MRVSRVKIAEIVAERLMHGESVKKLAKEVAAYLLLSGRSSELNSIMRDIIAIRAEEGSVEATAWTAHELTTQVEKEVKALIKTVRPNAKQVSIDNKLDPELIGGLKLNIVNSSLDLSVMSKVNQLKQLANQGGISG